MTQFPHIRIDEFVGLGQIVLLDLEFTCWEDSLSSGWSDPARPPEVLEIGLAAYDMQSDGVLGTFRRWIRPQLNPQLSAYCLNLLRVSQAEIDQSPFLGDVVKQVIEWEALLGIRDTLTCAWDIDDRLYLAQDTQRSDCFDPFLGRPHVSMMSLLCEVLGYSPREVADRDKMRATLGLLPNTNRHRALADALDLAQFCQVLKKWLVYGVHSE